MADLLISPASVDHMLVKIRWVSTSFIIDFGTGPIHSMVRIPHEAIPFLWECRSQETPGLLRLPRHKHLQRLGKSSRTWDMSHVISATCQHLNSPCTSVRPQSPIIHIVSPICFGKHPRRILGKHYFLLLKEGIAFPTVTELLSK